jgi:hypothetical protein
MEPIKYVCSGKLGDFIHLLSVINEKYLETGKKGILYISNTPESFQYGVKKAYSDTCVYVKSLPYIEDYLIHNEESVDIDLNAWRYNNLLFKTNWLEIFKKTYNVHWAANQWLFSEKITELENTVLIACGNTFRFPHNINFANLFQEYKNYDIVFISQNDDDYTFFKNTTQVSLKFRKAESLEDLIKAINSCYCFIGSLSSPLAIAYGLHKKKVVLLSKSTHGDNMHVTGLDSFLKDTEIRYT